MGLRLHVKVERIEVSALGALKLVQHFLVLGRKLDRLRRHIALGHMNDDRTDTFPAGAGLRALTGRGGIRATWSSLVFGSWEPPYPTRMG